jgi:hypothetical protein
MELGSSNHELREACTAWQGGRDIGSTPIRAAARVLTQTKHYFDAHFITNAEEKAKDDPRVMSHARVLLAELAARPARTIAEWGYETGVDASWVGRGIKSGDQDGQIVQSLKSGTIAMPLWGLSLDRGVAESFGNRFLFEVVGPFPAIAAWRESDFKHEERELIAGGRYEVIDMSTPDRTTEVQLRYIGPITAR